MYMSAGGEVVLCYSWQINSCLAPPFYMFEVVAGIVFPPRFRYVCKQLSLNRMFHK